MSNFMKKMSSVSLSMPTMSMDSAAAMMSSLAASASATASSSSTSSSVASVFKSSNANATAERKAMIAHTLSILEDVHLQTSASHSGMILAYTAKNMSPIVSPGIKFRWYRLPPGEGSGIEQIEESPKAWYAPTVDEIGCMICVQCEDNFDQGFSKYLEVSGSILCI